MAEKGSKLPQSPRQIKLGESAGSSEIEDTGSLKVFQITSGIAVILQILRYDDVQGYRVPVVFFKGLPSLFYPFVVLCAVAFTASISALSLRNRNRNMAWYCRLSSMTSLGAASILLSSAIFTTTILDL